jgi:3-hydroxyethyl bacteriochlorophyllide a dehydrogenase
MRNIGIEYPAKGEVAFYDLGDAPAPKPTEIVIRTHFSGVTNGTERHSLMGEHGWAGHFPSRNGYQAVGLVEAAGKDVQEFAAGDWVYYGHYVGHRGWYVQDVGGANAATGNHLCQKLPEGVSHKECALLGVAGVAMRGVRRFRIAPAQKVWVAGQGPIGHFAAQAARAVGAHVTISEADPRRLEIARECGAHVAIDAREPDAWQRIEKGGPYNCIIDACGLDSFLMDVYQHNVLAHAGVVGVLAVHTNITTNWSLLHMREASIEVSCHFSLDDLRVLLHFMQQGVIRVGPTISHFVSVDEAPSIYATLRDRPSELLGVVFDWTESK